jgi:uncharacterized protein
MRRLLLTLLLLVPGAAGAQSGQRDAITIGRIDSVWSATLKEQRKYLVYTPPSYGDTTYLPRAYPVLYLLDGDAHFHSVTGLLQILGTGVNGTFVVPEMIVIAIPNTDRTRDLTPTHAEKDPQGRPQPFLKTSGGMPSFFTFLQRELIPKIETTYRTAPYRVLVGHSLGGITAINALYTIPQSFNAYVAIDPSLWYDNQILLRQAKVHVSKPGLSGKALFVGQANTINADDTTSNTHFSSIVQFNGIVESYNQSGLRYAYKYYPQDDHGSVPLIAEYDALRFIFAPYKLDLRRSLERATYLTEHFDKVSKALGYQLLPPESMVTTKAIDLFALNASLYPASPHVYEALGQAWAVKGDSAQAIDWYQKSLALKPMNEGAKAMIEKLRGGKP